jgi:hypothetical protein
LSRELLVVGIVVVAGLGAAGLSAFIWYLNVSGLYAVIRESLRRRGKRA